MPPDERAAVPPPDADPTVESLAALRKEVLSLQRAAVIAARVAAQAASRAKAQQRPPRSPLLSADGLGAPPADPEDPQNPRGDLGDAPALLARLVSGERAAEALCLSLDLSEALFGQPSPAARAKRMVPSKFPHDAFATMGQWPPCLC